MCAEVIGGVYLCLYQFELAPPHAFTLSVAKGLSSSEPRCFAEPVLSGAEGLSMTCGMCTLNWYYSLRRAVNHDVGAAIDYSVDLNYGCAVER
jgi:hypothetical protein